MATKQLYQANAQWSTRPADQRFWTLEDAHQFCRHYADTARELELDFGTAEVVADAGGNLALAVPGLDTPATFTHWSFGQLARLSGAPADYLRKLPAELATRCIEAGLDRAFQGTEDFSRVGLVHANGSTVLRSVTSDKYTRFWNHQVFERLIDLQQFGWRVPPARPTGQKGEQTRKATKKDCLDVRMAGLGVKPGDLIAPAGIYSSDHDMFAFLVNEETRLDDGSEGGLSRGFFVSNSEVGAGALKLTLFHYRHVCGNHIVWDASDVVDIAIRHVGDVGGRFALEAEGALSKYLSASAKEEQERIDRARTLRLGGTAEEVLDAVFKAMRKGNRAYMPSGMSMKTLQAAMAAITDQDGDPFTVWGFANGMTRLSQQTGFADERAFLDRAAAQVLALAI
jgi:hypothetical protein